MGSASTFCCGRGRPARACGAVRRNSLANGRKSTVGASSDERCFAPRSRVPARDSPHRPAPSEGQRDQSSVSDQPVVRTSSERNSATAPPATAARVTRSATPSATTRTLAANVAYADRTAARWPQPYLPRTARAVRERGDGGCRDDEAHLGERQAGLPRRDPTGVSRHAGTPRGEPRRRPDGARTVGGHGATHSTRSA